MYSAEYDIYEVSDFYDCAHDHLKYLGRNPDKHDADKEKMVATIRNDKDKFRNEYKNPVQVLAFIATRICGHLSSYENAHKLEREALRQVIRESRELDSAELLWTAVEFDNLTLIRDVLAERNDISCQVIENQIKRIEQDMWNNRNEENTRRKREKCLNVLREYVK